MTVMPRTLRDYAAMARGKSPDIDFGDSSDLRPSPDVYSPAVQITNNLLYQSYFDSTVLEKAIREQQPTAQIVASTIREEGVPGYAIGLHPSSETPIAVEFLGSLDIGPRGTRGQPGASSTIILKPGEIMRPFGKPSDVPGAFYGFKWGLPFGWLGGGVATVVVFTTPDASVAWDTNQEVIFHRARYQILAPASCPTLVAAPFNWPVRFPWPKAFRTSTSNPQQGNPSIAVEPTRVEVRLRVASLANPATIRFLMMQTEPFDQSTGLTTWSTDVSWRDVTFPSFANPAGLVNLTTTYAIEEIIEGPLLRLGGDQCKVVLIDNPDAVAGTSVAAEYVDIVRWGRL